jgi:hypothetical protein
MAIAPEDLRAHLVREFNRRWREGGLERLNCLGWVGAFVHYPLDVAADLDCPWEEAVAEPPPEADQDSL